MKLSIGISQTGVPVYVFLHARSFCQWLYSRYGIAIHRIGKTENLRRFSMYKLLDASRRFRCFLIHRLFSSPLEISRENDSFNSSKYTIVIWTITTRNLTEICGMVASSALCSYRKFNGANLNSSFRIISRKYLQKYSRCRVSRGASIVITTW